MLSIFTVPMPVEAGPSTPPQPCSCATGWLTRPGDATDTIWLWLHRGRSRRILATLDDRELSDVGLTRAQARRESAKPFWRA
jgi:uncharacterized protein YjiS (DUF1127 family)